MEYSPVFQNIKEKDGKRVDEDELKTSALFF